MDSFFNSSIDPLSRDTVGSNNTPHKKRSHLSVDLTPLFHPDNAFQKKRPSRLNQLDTIVSSSRNQISVSVKHGRQNTLSSLHNTHSTPKIYAKSPLYQSTDDTTKMMSISTTLKSLENSQTRDSVHNFLIPFESGFQGKRMPFRSVGDLYQKVMTKEIIKSNISPVSNQNSIAGSQLFSQAVSKKSFDISSFRSKKVNRRKAARVMLNFKQACNVIRGPTLVEKTKADIENEDKLVDEHAHLLRDSLRSMVPLLESTLEFRKDKDLLEKFLKNYVTIAQKSKNLDLYLDALLLQGKIFLIYHEVHKALNVLKQMKNIAKTNRKFLHNLKAYKYLGKVFQQIGNFTMAEFYFIKLLQVSWITNKEKYEVQAYDLIGIQNYYMGDLDKAKFFHSKTIGGVIEPKDSEIRKLGISKMVNKMNEFGLIRKQLQLRTMEEELWRTDPPDSEDEFELPAYSLEKKETIKSSIEKGSPEEVLWEKKQRAQIKHERVHALKRLIEINEKKADRVKERFVIEKIEPSQISIIKQRNEASTNPPRPQVLLSHLSPNRFLNNFHNLDSNAMANPLFLREMGAESLILLDARSLEEIRKVLYKSKVNLLDAELEISRALGKPAILEEMKINSLQKYKARKNLRLNSDF